MICTPHQILFDCSNQEELRWAGYVAHMGEMRGACRVSVGKHDGKTHFENLGINRKKILNGL
jgi:hypothetical protein